MATRIESSLWGKTLFPPRRKCEQWGEGGCRNHSLHKARHSCPWGMWWPRRGGAHEGASERLTRRAGFEPSPPGCDTPLQLGDPGQNSFSLWKKFPENVGAWSPSGRFSEEWSQSWALRGGRIWMGTEKQKDVPDWEAGLGKDVKRRNLPWGPF